MSNGTRILNCPGGQIARDDAGGSGPLVVAAPEMATHEVSIAI